MQQREEVGEKKQQLHVEHIVSAQQAMGLIDLSKLSQQQAAVAINRAELMQNLFMDAATRLEGLLVENSDLRSAMDAVKPEAAPVESSSSSANNSTSSPSPSGTAALSWQQRNLQLARDGLVAGLEKIRQDKAPTSFSWRSLGSRRSAAAKASKPFVPFVTANLDEETLHACAAACCALFRRIKCSTSSGHHIPSNDTIGAGTLRKCIDALGSLKGGAALRPSDVDLLLAQQGLVQLSVHHVAQLLVACFHRRFPQLHSGQLLLDRLLKGLSSHLAAVGDSQGVKVRLSFPACLFFALSSARFTYPFSRCTH